MKLVCMCGRDVKLEKLQEGETFGRHEGECQCGRTYEVISYEN